MNDLCRTQTDDSVLAEVNQSQLRYFTTADQRCRGLELPEGILLRYNMAKSLYFYLRTSVEDGAVITKAYSSDTPFDYRKVVIGEVSTPMFDKKSHQFDGDVDRKQIEKLRTLLHAWVNFIADTAAASFAFSSFSMESQPKSG